ncbi:hypothetical protein GCM10023237_10410 [Streptomyces coeruleoprunus]
MAARGKDGRARGRRVAGWLLGGVGLGLCLGGFLRLMVAVPSGPVTPLVMIGSVVLLEVSYRCGENARGSASTSGDGPRREPRRGCAGLPPPSLGQGEVDDVDR